MKTISESIDVNVPLSTAYHQWSQFEDFPAFMEGIESVVEVDDTTVEWSASIGGRPVRWRARIVEQVPDERIAWVSLEGARNDGLVTFQPIGPDRTRVHLSIDADPTGVVADLDSTVGATDRRIRGDLERFRAFVERREARTGAWRGQVPEPRAGMIDAVPAGHASSADREAPRAATASSGADPRAWTSQARPRDQYVNPADADEPMARRTAGRGPARTNPDDEGSFATGVETGGTPDDDVAGQFATGIASDDALDDESGGSFATGIASDDALEDESGGSFATGTEAIPQEGHGLREGHDRREGRRPG